MKTIDLFMKKIVLSLSLILASSLYILFGASGVPADVIIPGTANDAQSSSSNSLPVVQPPPKTAVVPPPPTPVPVPIAPPPPPPPKPKGMYADGTYTGIVADAYYGLVQIQAVIQGGKLINVSFLQYPNDRRTSQYINGQAMPILKSEAIQAQSANVDIVSGATDTSMAFQQSLADALAQAKS